MCQECEELTRRGFLKGMLVGSAALGIGLGRDDLLFAQSTNIKFSTWHPPVSREVKTVWTPMLEEVKKRSGGQMGYTMYAGGALGKGPEHFDIVAKGLSDMGYFTATWTPGRFPLTDVLSLAAWVDGKDVAADIGNAVYNRILKDEFKNVKVLELNGCIQSFIWTKKPVSKMADLKGMKLRSPGGHQTNYIKSLGAEPVFMPLGRRLHGHGNRHGRRHRDLPARHPGLQAPRGGQTRHGPHLRLRLRRDGHEHEQLEQADRRPEEDRRSELAPTPSRPRAD